MESPPVKYARTSDGVHIAYQTWGDGPIDILISGALWWHIEYQWTEPSVAAMNQRFGRLGRVIAFDKRGTGLSDRVPLDRLPTLETRTDDITSVLDAVGSEKVVLVGQNHGAPMAILFAATHPDRTHSLVCRVHSHGLFAPRTTRGAFPNTSPSELWNGWRSIGMSPTRSRRSRRIT